MRVLLDNECVAVAGGHESECVQNVTTAAIATGFVCGAAAGGMAGAVAGAGVGSLVAQIVAEPLCRWAAGDESQEEYGEGSGGGFFPEATIGSGVEVEDSSLPIHPPHQLRAWLPQDDKI